MTDTRLRTLKRFLDDERRMPSYGELAELFGFKSKNAAQYLVNKWIEDGVVTKGAKGRLLPGSKLGAIRMVGTVEAGFPSAAEEENADAISLDEMLITNKEASFMLRVSGESMIEAGIRPGDMVVVERGREPKSGDIVIAEVDEKWTMKYFERHGKQIVLRPANKAFPLITPTEQLRVAGVVTAVVRKYQ